MSDNQVTKVIGDNTYKILLLPATSGFTIALNIAELLAPAIGSSVDGLRQDEFLDTPNTFHNTAMSLIQQMDKINVLNMIQAMLVGAEVNDKELNFDDHFRANYGELIQVIEFVLGANFSSFFTDQGLRTRLMDFLMSLINKEETPKESLEE